MAAVHQPARRASSSLCLVAFRLNSGRRRASACGRKTSIASGAARRSLYFQGRGYGKDAYLANGGFDVEPNATYDDYETGLVYLCEDPPSSIAVATAASFVAIFCMGVSGNVLLLYVLLRHEDLRQVTSLLVLNMAASDLLLATTLPFWSTYHLSHWVFGPALCRVLVGAYFVGLYCGLMFLTALTVDRYVTVVHGRSPR
ncbi:C-C chemokine receptor type 5-like [Anguilla rostrata]|uniref:C-C chemokine receptor type 5-like n=1 Tax=Anguilla rostrata TaxID=7938 RepID=UPI0030D29D63